MRGSYIRRYLAMIANTPKKRGGDMFLDFLSERIISSKQHEFDREIMSLFNKPKERTLRKEDLYDGMKVECVESYTDYKGDCCCLGEHTVYESCSRGRFYVISGNRSKVYIVGDIVGDMSSHFIELKEYKMINELSDNTQYKATCKVIDPLTGKTIAECGDINKVEIGDSGSAYFGRMLSSNQIFNPPIFDVTGMFKKVTDPTDEKLKELQETIDKAQREITEINRSR